MPPWNSSCSGAVDSVASELALRITTPFPSPADRIWWYVLSANAITGPYAFEGQLELPGNRWAIDATVFSAANASYVVRSGWPDATNGEQDLSISRLGTPTTVTGRAVRISRTELDWETNAGSVGVLVNEGPAALVRDGRSS